MRLPVAIQAHLAVTELTHLKELAQMADQQIGLDFVGLRSDPCFETSVFGPLSYFLMY